MKTLSISADRASLKDVPTTNGIYIFKSANIPLYIGKSVNLKARLISHFEQAKIDPKAAGYVEQAENIKLITSDSEFKALLLESEFIRKYKPKYNVRWRDDKSYLYIKATIKDTYPKFFITRRERQKKALYFGPFQSVKVATSILREIRKVFPFCTQNKITNQRCFYSKIKLCHPCPNEIEKITDPKLKLDNQKKYRKQIKQAIRVLKGSIETVTKDLYKQIDILTKQNKFEEAITYRNRLFRLQGLVSYEHFDSDQPEYFNMSEKLLESLKHLLHHYFIDLNDLHRIECYDISNLSFAEATGSMVVFTDGLTDKKEYKRFKIKNEKAQSDFEMIEEVIKRRLNHDNWGKANLMVIDGGKPQIRTVMKTMKEQGKNIPLIGIAKRPDRIIIGTEALITLRPRLNHPGFRLVQALRDESHRFAKSYHLYLRDKKML